MRGEPPRREGIANGKVVSGYSDHLSLCLLAQNTPAWASIWIGRRRPAFDVDVPHRRCFTRGTYAEIDEFKGAWRALGTLAPERLSALRRVATIESIGSSTRIEGSKLSDREVERLLANLEIKSFATRDEQEVAGYAELMELVFRSWQDLPSPRTTSSNCTRPPHLQQEGREASRRIQNLIEQRGRVRQSRQADRHRICDGNAFRYAPSDDRADHVVQSSECDRRLHPLLVIGFLPSCFSKSIRFRTAMVV